MGTTHDYKLAIECGSNMIRIGEVHLWKKNMKNILFYGSGNISSSIIEGLLKCGYKKKIFSRIQEIFLQEISLKS